ncbi:MAG: hypothetical protein Ct9H90mP27_3780 [Gammaproteobacteria bacterium]|nr:MAG: hypothetical protein Ct9H90mP27_3780 [Gammaproteobacteria bacterium]
MLITVIRDQVWKIQFVEGGSRYQYFLSPNHTKVDDPQIPVCKESGLYAPGHRICNALVIHGINTPLSPVL